MRLSDQVHTFGQYLRRKYAARVHKLALHAGFTCPNRDGEKGIGGCTFCNNASFSPNAKREPDIEGQLAAGREVVLKRTGAKRYIGYFQAYTNTYDEVERLDTLYRRALAQHDVVGLSVGTRPDCVPDEVLELLAGYRDEGHEVWLELGLQSANDATLDRVNRGHGFAEYVDAVRRSRAHGLSVCTHLIVGLPGERAVDSLDSLAAVLAEGTDGLKLHPLHVVRGSQLARDFRAGDYQPPSFEDYVEVAAEMIRRTPREIVYHRVTATAQQPLLLAPDWCAQKWAVINAITERLARDGGQGSALGSALHSNQRIAYGTGLPGGQPAVAESGGR